MLWFKKNTYTSLYCQTRLQQLPAISVPAKDYDILESPAVCHKRMLELINAAQERIMMTVLYLQDDKTGREILEALYKAKERNPKLHIMVYVDYHRAQRGLIGQEKSLGNAALYYKMAEQCQGTPPAVYGVPVKKREIFGVMHLKGCVFDDIVLYSGASINDVYMGNGPKYRLDRYHEIKSKALADCLVSYTNQAFHINFAVQDFSQGKVKGIKEIKDDQKVLRRHLTRTPYVFKNSKLKSGEVGITPLVGLGKKGNALNRAILWLITAARSELFICTPYFNPPKILLETLQTALQRKVKVTLVVGDKTANDFYIREDEKFSAVGAVPYIYEQNLKNFLKLNADSLKDGTLNVQMWHDGINTYHLKGIFCDRTYALITGNNLNPRAWGLDLENGLLVHDPQLLMQEKFMHEKQYILRHCTRLTGEDMLQDFEQYPENVKLVLNRVRRFKASIVIKQLL